MSAQSKDPPANEPDLVTVRFTDMAYGGDAVGKADASGLTLFAWPGITGEQARVEITERRKNLLRGTVTEVIKPSPLREQPPCPYFGPCGGCQWQHIEYRGQVQFKHDILRAQLSRIAGIADPDAVLAPPIASPQPFNYRNTSHFAVDAATKSLGYFTRDSHSIVPVAECPISNGGINAAIPLVNPILAKAPEEQFVREQTKGGMWVWQVTIRSSENTGHTVVILHSRKQRSGRRPASGRGPHARTRPEIDEGGPNTGLPLVRREVRGAVVALDRQEASERLALTVVEVMEDGTINSLGSTRAAASIVAEATADTMSGSLLSASLEQSAKESGPSLGSWLEKLAGRYYWVAPEAFFQVNTEAAELLVEEVSGHVPDRISLLIDAHAGVGTFALALQRRAGKVLCFETNPAAIASGRWTALSSNVRNVEFRLGRAEDLLARLPQPERPDLILLDPPRSGCHPALLAEIARRRIPRIIYVSCDPSTLARDIKTLAPVYTLSRARMIDMFPQTFHLETVAVLDLN